MLSVLNIQGYVTIYDADTGEKLTESSNSVVQIGRTQILEIIAGVKTDSSYLMSKIAIGTDDGTILPASDDNTELGSETIRDVCDHLVSGDVLYLNTYFSKTDANIVIREAGVFDNESPSNMFCRSILLNPFDNETDPHNLTVTWTLTLSNN